MAPKPNVVAAHLASLPADRRAAVEAVRAVIRANLDDGFEEGVQHGMLAYSVPHRVYPAGYHANPKEPVPFVSVASQKGGLSVHLFGLYVGADDLPRFEAEWRAAGKKLDMGKSCVRFKRLEDASLEAIGAAIARMPLRRFLAAYEASRARPAEAEAPKKVATKAGAKKAPATKAPAKKAPAKKAAVKERAVSEPAVKKPAAQRPAKLAATPAKRR
jgi:hypothetical protein